MEGLWLASYVALWIVAAALGLVALSHSRLLGLMYRRIGPGIARPLTEGPELETRIEEIQARTVDEQEWSRKFPIDHESLVIFISPQCQACNELIPHVKDFLDRVGWSADLKLISVLADAGMNRAYVEYKQLRNVGYLIGEGFARQVQITATPYALKLGSNGAVLAKGVVNDYEQLASLWNVSESDRRDRAASGSNSGEEDKVA